MSIAALVLNGLLATLLLAALAMGARLNARLKGIKDGNSAFVLAVSELNAAASKAQGALADLRAATDEATDVLGGRIARAREASDRLEKLVNRAETVPMPQSVSNREREREITQREALFRDALRDESVREAPARELPVRASFDRAAPDRAVDRDVGAIERELRDATHGGGLAALLARMEGAVEPSARLARASTLAPERSARAAARPSVDDDLFEDFGGRA
jgi:hypothetical protein